MKIILVAAVSMALGTLLGVAVRHILEWRKRRTRERRRRREASEDTAKKKMSTMRAPLTGTREYRTEDRKPGTEKDVQCFSVPGFLIGVLQYLFL